MEEESDFIRDQMTMDKLRSSYSSLEERRRFFLGVQVYRALSLRRPHYLSEMESCSHFGMINIRNYKYSECRSSSVMSKLLLIVALLLPVATSSSIVGEDLPDDHEGLPYFFKLPDKDYARMCCAHCIDEKTCILYTQDREKTCAGLIDHESVGLLNFPGGRIVTTSYYLYEKWQLLWIENGTDPVLRSRDFSWEDCAWKSQVETHDLLGPQITEILIKVVTDPFYDYDVLVSVKDAHCGISNCDVTFYKKRLGESIQHRANTVAEPAKKHSGHNKNGIHTRKMYPEWIAEASNAPFKVKEEDEPGTTISTHSLWSSSRIIFQDVSRIWRPCIFRSTTYTSNFFGLNCASASSAQSSIVHHWRNLSNFLETMALFIVEIVDKILGHLDLYEIKEFRQVCTFWKYRAARELKRRPKSSEFAYFFNEDVRAIKETSKLYFEMIYSPQKSDYTIFSELLALVERDDVLVENQENRVSFALSGSAKDARTIAQSSKKREGAECKLCSRKLSSAARLTSYSSMQRRGAMTKQRTAIAKTSSTRQNESPSPSRTGGHITASQARDGEKTWARSATRTKQQQRPASSEPLYKQKYTRALDKYQPVNIDAQDKFDRIPLHYALIFNNQNLAAWLLRSSANPNLTENQGFIPWHVICQKKNDAEELARLLFEIAAEKNETVQIEARDKLGNPPLNLALRYGNKKVAKLLLGNRVNLTCLNKNGLTPLHNICKSLIHYDELMNLFCEKIEANHPTDTPLHMAARHGEKKVIELLLSHGANDSSPDASGATPLHVICNRSEDDDVVKVFCDAVSKSNRVVQTDVQDSKGRTPLHLAVMRVNPNAVDTLLRKFANPNIADAEGSTILHYLSNPTNLTGGRKGAKSFRDMSTTFVARIKKMITHKLDVNVQDNLGNTPLHYALKGCDGPLGRRPAPPHRYNPEKSSEQSRSRSFQKSRCVDAHVYIAALARNDNMYYTATLCRRYYPNFSTTIAAAYNIHASYENLKSSYFGHIENFNLDQIIVRRDRYNPSIAVRRITMFCHTQAYYVSRSIDFSIWTVQYVAAAGAAAGGLDVHHRHDDHRLYYQFRGMRVRINVVKTRSSRFHHIHGYNLKITKFQAIRCIASSYDNTKNRVCSRRNDDSRPDMGLSPERLHNRLPGQEVRDDRGPVSGRDLQHPLDPRLLLLHLPLAAALLTQTPDLNWYIYNRHYPSWRVYLLIFSVLPMIGLLLVCFMPKSPKFLMAPGPEQGGPSGPEDHVLHESLRAGEQVSGNDYRRLSPKKKKMIVEKMKNTFAQIKELIWQQKVKRKLNDYCRDKTRDSISHLKSLFSKPYIRVVGTIALLQFVCMSE
ncbi:unnamed protein product [Trichogramma brassicae]|uniref:Uncharacterized protein n=1 Tax=Trichogramma brassicae TaxID=86971 RepID=A0A6H5HSI7_9HYME|nr:unnamed protein product [Trichogramma brassicae]